MSNHLGAAEAADLLAVLRETVRDFAARAARLSEESRSKLAREQKQRQNAAEEHLQQSEAARQQTEAAFEQTRNALVSNFEKRKVRIGKAYQSSKEQRLKEIDDRVGARKYELQKKMLQAERDRQAGLSTAAGRLQQFKADLETELHRLTQLEQQAQLSFKGYRQFHLLFRGAYDKVQPGLDGDEDRLLARMRDSLDKADQELNQEGWKP